MVSHSLDPLGWLIADRHLVRPRDARTVLENSLFADIPFVVRDDGFLSAIRVVIGLITGYRKLTVLSTTAILLHIVGTVGARRMTLAILPVPNAVVERAEDGDR